MKTLDDMKRENAEDEIVEEAAPQAVDEIIEDDAAEITPEEDEAEQAEQATEDTEAVEVEAWMEAGEQEEDSDTFTASDIAGLRRKMKGKLKGKDDENERLRQEIESLRSGVVQPQSQDIKRPRIDDFTTSEEYEDAHEAYLLAKFENKNNKSQQDRANEARDAEHKRKMETEIDAHYQRAAEMVKTHSIAPERFKVADKTFRDAMEEVNPGRGDNVVDHMLSLLGEGSEKVGYYLGNNKTALNELKLRMMNDKAGLSAMSYLGELKAKVTMPAKATRKAPKPATSLGGDKGTGEAKSLSALKSAYNKAKDGNARMSARMAYKKAGGNTKEL